MSNDLFKNLLDNQISLIQKIKLDDDLQNNIHNAASVIIKALKQNSPFLVMGNGGSAADAAHITGELIGKFIYERKPLNAICLNSELAAITAISNDDDYSQIFARQVKAYACPGGIVFGISTSGNSQNVINAFNNKKGSIIDRLRIITDVESYLKKKFNINIDYNMKGNKIINLYNKQII